MMNDIQKRILAEATKFGGSDISKIQSIANTLSEMPMVDSPSSAGTLFGHSATQFEVKMRQVMKKMGYEKGILGMKLYGSLMNIFFANEGKAKDFVLVLNQMTRRVSTGTVAIHSTMFDPKTEKRFPGAKALVIVNFSKIKKEEFETENGLMAFLESESETVCVEDIEEAFSSDQVPAHLLGGRFRNEKGKIFEYRLSTDAWGLKHGLPHEIFVLDGKQTRAGLIKGTVAYISTDEDAEGKPVLQKWKIKQHVKYLKHYESIGMSESWLEDIRVHTRKFNKSIFGWATSPGGITAISAALGTVQPELIPIIAVVTPALLRYRQYQQDSQRQLALINKTIKSQPRHENFNMKEYRICTEKENISDILSLNTNIWDIDVEDNIVCEAWYNSYKDFYQVVGRHIAFKTPQEMEDHIKVCKKEISAFAAANGLGIQNISTLLGTSAPQLKPILAIVTPMMLKYAEFKKKELQQLEVVARAKM